MARVRKTFVLVHGAWHGGWCYRKVADLLLNQGHKVYTPTLTGLGERSHLSDFPIDCSTHVRDVINVIRWEELSDVILCGHSYGGAVITGVADFIPERIAALVYLDALIPQSGLSILELLADASATAGSTVAEQILTESSPAGDGSDERFTPPVSALAFNVNLSDRALVDRLSVPQPIATFTERLEFTGAWATVPTKLCILATDWDGAPARRFFDGVPNQAEWVLHTLACGHDVMLDQPEVLTEILTGCTAA